MDRKSAVRSFSIGVIQEIEAHHFRFDFRKFNRRKNDMAYNKAKEEYKWKVWKEQEEKKLRELGVSEEVIAELRDYDWNCFKQERNYKNHQMPDTDL